MFRATPTLTDPEIPSGISGIPGAASSRDATPAGDRPLSPGRAAAPSSTDPAATTCHHPSTTARRIRGATTGLATRMVRRSSPTAHGDCTHIALTGAKNTIPARCSSAVTRGPVRTPSRRLDRLSRPDSVPEPCLGAPSAVRNRCPGEPSGQSAWGPSGDNSSPCSVRPRPTEHLHGAHGDSATRLPQGSSSSVDSAWPHGQALDQPSRPAEEAGSSKDQLPWQPQRSSAKKSA